MGTIPMGQATVQKDLIELPSGNFAEAIYFDRPEKQVICFSTQLFCAVGCAFCASPGKEKTINLTTGEMLLQIGTMMRRYGRSDKVILFSFMGEGEPLLNYKNVLPLLHKLPEAYPNCRISLSTSGVAPDKIIALANEEFAVPFKLQISVHVCDEETRNWFMPHAKSIPAIKDALLKYHTLCPERSVELNFALIKGVNDSLVDAVNIVNEFPQEYIKISKFNPLIKSDFESPSDEHIQDFVDYLIDRGLTVEYHQTDGSGVGAACGQTRGMKKS
jgi:23S rRNA (adenine2503-C2)-methyltransferase